MEWLLVSYLFFSIVILYFGAEITLDSAELVGKRMGLSPLIIGALIVGFGTSLPELFVSQLACFRGHPEIALGNIIGSNIANIFLVLGVGGVLKSLPVGDRELRGQFIFHCLITLILGGILYLGKVNWMVQLIFTVFFLFYLYQTLKSMKQDQGGPSREVVDKLSPIVPFKLTFGFALLYGGGELLVYSGTGLGQLWGVSTYVISAIFVAFGTSFPELVTVLIASLKKKDTDIIVGNILGSNIFNIALVFGSLGIYQFDVAANYLVEILALIGVSIVFILLHYLKLSLGRLVGFLFLSVYGAMVYFWL